MKLIFLIILITGYNTLESQEKYNNPVSSNYLFTAKILLDVPEEYDDDIHRWTGKIHQGKLVLTQSISNGEIATRTVDLNLIDPDSIRFHPPTYKKVKWLTFNCIYYINGINFEATTNNGKPKKYKEYVAGIPYLETENNKKIIQSFKKYIKTRVNKNCMHLEEASEVIDSIKSAHDITLVSGKLKREQLKTQQLIAINQNNFSVIQTHIYDTNSTKWIFPLSWKL